MRIMWTALVIAERIVFVTSGGYAQETVSGTFGDHRLSIAGLALSVATNGVATIAIACRAWYVISKPYKLYFDAHFSRQYRASFSSNQCSKASPVKRILTLLVESGLIYLLYWVSHLKNQLDIQTCKILSILRESPRGL
jgi:hypothetical protein